MSIEDTKVPTKVDESTLDEISGGPHFHSFDNTYPDHDAVMKVRHDTAKAMIQKAEG